VVEWTVSAVGLAEKFSLDLSGSLNDDAQQRLTSTATRLTDSVLLVEFSLAVTSSSLNGD
jgi:hypothetical protein